MNIFPLHVIGLTGLPSSGKGEVANALRAFAGERGLRAEHLSFSDEIKAEARRRGIADTRFTRDLLSRLAVEMRQAEGPGVLAARLGRKIEQWPHPRPQIFVVEALRHVGEIKTLRKAFGKKFILVSVETEPRTIARRLIARRRADESPDALQSEDNAVRLLERELKGQLSPLGPNVSPCMQAADLRLDNNGTLEALRASVRRLFDSITADSTT